MNQGEEQAPRRRVVYKRQRKRAGINDSRADDDDSDQDQYEDDQAEEVVVRRQQRARKPNKAGAAGKNASKVAAADPQPDQPDIDSYDIEYDEEEPKEKVEDSQQDDMINLDSPLRMEEDNDGSESGLSELSNEHAYFAARLTY